MKPNFKDINIKGSKAACSSSEKEWAEKNHISKDWLTPEQIPVKPVYTKADLEGMEQLNYAAGLPPFLCAVLTLQCMPCVRGPFVSMPDSLPQKNPTHSTVATWRPDKKVCR